MRMPSFFLVYALSASLLHFAAALPVHADTDASVILSDAVTLKSMNVASKELRDAKPDIAEVQTSSSLAQQKCCHIHHRHHSHHWHHSHHSHHWHHRHHGHHIHIPHRHHIHVPIGKIIKKIANDWIEDKCEEKAHKAADMMNTQGHKDVQPAAISAAPWSDLKHLGVAMFMAFVSYNDESHIRSLVLDAKGATKAGGFKYNEGTFFSGKHGVQRFLAYGAISGVQTVVLAFRGTAGLKDVLADATAAQLPWKHGGKHGHVHAGMYAQFEEGLSSLHSTIASHIANGRKSFLVTGHSLGGGVAVLAAMYIAEEFRGRVDRVEVITFGGAASHSASFEAALDKMVTFRSHIVHGLDPVPCLGIKLLKEVENTKVVQFEKESTVFYTPRRRYDCNIALEFPLCNAMDYHTGLMYCASVGKLIGGTIQDCGMVGPANA